MIRTLERLPDQSIFCNGGRKIKCMDNATWKGVSGFKTVLMDKEGVRTDFLCERHARRRFELNRGYGIPMQFLANGVEVGSPW